MCKAVKLFWLVALFTSLAACDGAASKSTGPTFNCTLAQTPGGTGDKSATSEVGDSTQNCGPNRQTNDNHAVQGVTP